MTTSLAPFRPYEVELGATLGWSDSDGSSLNVVEHATNDGMVFHHERIHSALSNGSFDGTLLKAIRIAGPRLADPQHADELAQAGQYLFERSRFAHECAATYIGVMSLKTEEERVTALTRLPNEYRAYYNFMSAIVDGHCKSSYLRYLIAQSIAYFWFSSCALIEFASANYRGPFVMCDEFCPDWRANRSASWLTQVGVDGAIAASIDAILMDKALCRAVQIFSPQDLKNAWDDDSWWIRHSGKIAGFVEELMSEITFSYFVKNSDLKSAPVEVIKNAELGKKLIEPLYELAGMKVMSVNEKRRESLDAAADLAMIFREFITVARTVSHIQPHIAALSFTAIKVLGMGDSETFIKRNGLVDIVFPEDESQGGAYFAEFGKTISDDSGTAKWGLSGYRRCTSQLASEVLRRIIKQQVEGAQSIQVDCVVIPVSFDDQFSSYNSLLRVLNEATGPAATQGASQYSLDMEFRRLFGREFLYAYVRDDWLRIVGMEEPTRPATYVGTIGVHINGREQFLLNVARIAGFAGTLIKAYPMHAASVIEDYYRKCFEKGYLRQLNEEPDGCTQLEHCRRAFVSITGFWHQL